jgi:hypothetical protein
MAKDAVNKYAEEYPFSNKPNQKLLTYDLPNFCAKKQVQKCKIKT